MYALIAGVAAYVALLMLKSRLSGSIKLIAAVIGLVVIVGMLSSWTRSSGASCCWAHRW